MAKSFETGYENEEVITVWAVTYGISVRSLWETREEAEAEEAIMRQVFPLKNRWGMHSMKVLRKVPTEKGTEQ